MVRSDFFRIFAVNDHGSASDDFDVKPASLMPVEKDMASGINFYSELAISLIRISDIANSE